jgi:hypothetical protein
MNGNSAFQSEGTRAFPPPRPFFARSPFRVAGAVFTRNPQSPIFDESLQLIIFLRFAGIS